MARYDKMHLFGFKDNESYDESRTVLYGDHVSCAAPFGRVGLSVCYDTLSWVVPRWAIVR